MKSYYSRLRVRYLENCFLQPSPPPPRLPHFSSPLSSPYFRFLFAFRFFFSLRYRSFSSLLFPFPFFFFFFLRDNEFQGIRKSFTILRNFSFHFSLSLSLVGVFSIYRVTIHSKFNNAPCSQLSSITAAPLLLFLCTLCCLDTSADTLPGLWRVRAILRGRITPYRNYFPPIPLYPP